MDRVNDFLIFYQEYFYNKVFLYGATDLLGKLHIRRCQFRHPKSRPKPCLNLICNLKESLNATLYRKLIVYIS